MAGQRRNDDGSGCLALFGVLVAIVATLWALSAIGHLLGLTPTYSEAFDRPDGWVGRHYRGVVWGYLLTIVVLVTTAVLLWLAAGTRSPDPQVAARARSSLRGARSFVLLLLFAVLFLPIGKRPGVDTRDGTTGSSNEGNVPNVVGMTAERAEAALDAASLSAELRETPHDDGRCRVFAQDPPAGAELDDYGTVELRCRVRIPSVVGMKAEQADVRLSDAGFETRYANEPTDYDLSRCRVTRQSRTGSAEPNTTIGMRLRCVRPPPPPAPAAERVTACDPNYELECLDPSVSDYDCEGGTGDGPGYSGYVIVVGEDRYGLDANHDGEGCE